MLICQIPTKGPSYILVKKCEKYIWCNQYYNYTYVYIYIQHTYCISLFEIEPHNFNNHCLLLKTHFHILTHTIFSVGWMSWPKLYHKLDPSSDPGCHHVEEILPVDTIIAVSNQICKMEDLKSHLSKQCVKEIMNHDGQHKVTGNSLTKNRNCKKIKINHTNFHDVKSKINKKIKTDQHLNHGVRFFRVPLKKSNKSTCKITFPSADPLWLLWLPVRLAHDVRCETRPPQGTASPTGKPGESSTQKKVFWG